MNSDVGNRALLKQRKQDNRLMEVERDFLVRDPNQDREDFSEEKIAEIAATMQERIDAGNLPNAEPLWVEQLPSGEYQIISGETRDRAAESIGYTGPMSCLVYQNLSSIERDDLMALANSGRNDLNLWEKARAVCRRIERGQDRKHVMALYGVEKTVLSRLESFYNNCCDDVKEVARLRLRNDINFLLDLNSLDEAKRTESINALKDKTFDSQAFKTEVRAAKDKTKPDNQCGTRKRKSTTLSIKADAIRFIISESSVLRRGMKEHFPGAHGYKKAYDGELVAAFSQVLEETMLLEEPKDDSNE